MDVFMRPLYPPPRDSVLPIWEPLLPTYWFSIACCFSIKPSNVCSTNSVKNLFSFFIVITPRPQNYSDW